MNTRNPSPLRSSVMTIKEVASYLGVHSITIYRLLKSSDIPAMKLGGQWRFKKEVIDAWLAAKMSKKRRSH